MYKIAETKYNLWNSMSPRFGVCVEIRASADALRTKIGVTHLGFEGRQAASPQWMQCSTVFFWHDQAGNQCQPGAAGYLCQWPQIFVIENAVNHVTYWGVGRGKEM